VVVPIGSEASAEFVRKVAEAVRLRVVAIGDDISLDDPIKAPVVRLTAEDWKRRAPVPDTSRVSAAICVTKIFNLLRTFVSQRLPRTAETGKLKRAEIRDRLAAERAGKAPGTVPNRLDQQCTPDMVVEEIERRTGRKVTAETRLDELGLSSVDRVELVIEFEGHSQRTIEESEFAAAQTIGDLKAVVERVLNSEELSGAVAQPEFPGWNRSWLSRAVRRVNLSGPISVRSRSSGGKACSSGPSDLLRRCGSGASGRAKHAPAGPNTSNLWTCDISAKRES
jgi:acyl carrier protein